MLVLSVLSANVDFFDGLLMRVFIVKTLVFNKKCYDNCICFYDPLMRLCLRSTLYSDKFVVNMKGYI